MSICDLEEALYRYLILYLTESVELFEFHVMYELDGRRPMAVVNFVAPKHGKNFYENFYKNFKKLH